MIADLPPTDQLRQAPILYNADTRQAIGGRMQRWANGFTLPSGAAVQVRLGRLPTASAEPAGVTYGDTAEGDVLYWDPTIWRGRLGQETMYHELAHIYERRRATDSTRSRFQRIMNDTRAWRSPSNSPHEQFAEAAALYMRGYRRPPEGGYGFSPTKRQWRQTRRLFNSL